MPSPRVSVSTNPSTKVSGDNTALLFNRFVNEIFGNLLYQTFGRSKYLFDF
jgi:hypothetical protein